MWPYVKDSYSKIELPKISASDLKAQLARRKANAAPGLDGWRTVEVQSFPLKVLSAIADYFNQVESGCRTLPQSLTLAKQIILDKGSEDVPLSKRLISLLSVLLLSYTGLRFRQLQVWQNQCLPMQLYGGIKNRHMSSVFTQMQLQIDSSIVEKQNLIGLKLDKSKCFDRLVPSIVASLFVAFGLPIGLTKFFLQIYQGLKRYMCYKQWISTRPTTAPNGLVQGCSLSLLAINLQMSVWIIMLQKLPQIQAAAFVDDSYLWTKAVHLDLLQQAVAITNEWDEVVGQSLNMKKCQIWATCSKERSRLRECFPTMKLVLNLEVLGAIVHTSNISKTDWSPKKTTKILRDIQLIKAIPCSRVVQEHLLSVKVVPQLSFAANHNGIPKKVLATFQNAVTDGLWRGRPMWRSKGILLAIIADPSRCDPVTARAVNVIVETIDFLKKTDDTHRDSWQKQHNSNTIRQNSLIQHFYQAASVLGVEIEGPFHLSLWNATPVPFLDLAKRDVKKILKIAARDTCYRSASRTSRKDIFPAVNILDHFATSLSNSECRDQWHKGLPMQCHRDASIVGSCITNDRRFAAGLSETDLCRFCNTSKESFAHLAHECSALPLANRPFCDTSKGPNFGNLGIVETSFVQAQKRLQISSVSSIAVKPWSKPFTNHSVDVWSDGSCDETKNFWYTIGGFAVVSEDAKTLASGPVFHWALSAYSCELWALIVAFATSDSPITCHTDCLSLCNQVNEMISVGKVSPTWAHLEWWNFLHMTYMIRCECVNKPLCVEWCPSHVLDNIPLEKISEQQARSFNTTWINIARNRLADKIAKKACFKQKPLTDNQTKADHKATVEWQMWITKICALISETSVAGEVKTKPWKASSSAIGNIDKTVRIFPEDLTVLHPVENFASLLPKWDWYLTPDNCDWAPSFDCATPLASFAKISKDQWEYALRFFHGISWICEPSRKTAFIEIAYHAWFSGCIFPGIEHNPKAFAVFLRKVINQCDKISLCIHPGTVKAANKSLGKTLPSGFVDGATFAIHPKAMKKLAIDLFAGRNQALSSWSCPFAPP